MKETPSSESTPATVAKTRSLDDSAEEGGLIPFLVHQEDSPLAALAFTTDPGQTAGPVELADVQVEDMCEGEHLHLPFGDGTLDVGPTIAALTEIGFDQLVSVELSRDSHRAPPIAAAAMAHLRTLESRTTA